MEYRNCYDNEIKEYRREVSNLAKIREDILEQQTLKMSLKDHRKLSKWKQGRVFLESRSNMCKCPQVLKLESQIIKSFTCQIRDLTFILKVLIHQGVFRRKWFYYLHFKKISLATGMKIIGSGEDGRWQDQFVITHKKDGLIKVSNKSGKMGLTWERFRR